MESRLNNTLAIFLVFLIMVSTIGSVKFIEYIDDYKIRLTGKSSQATISLKVGEPEVITSPAASSSSGGSGGGGGGGSGGGGAPSRPLEIIEDIPVENIELIFQNEEGIKKLIRKLEINNEVLIPIENPDISIQSIKINSKNTEENIEVTLKELNPSEIAEILSYDENRLDSAIYKFVKITAKNSKLEDVKINNAKIFFYVEKSWLEKYGIKEEEVRLARLRDGKWSYLETKKLQDTAKYVYYESVTLEFSLFGITYGKLFEKAKEAVKEEVPVTTPPPVYMLSSVILLLLIGFNVIFFYHRSRFKKLEKKLSTISSLSKKKKSKRRKQISITEGILEQILKKKP